MKMNNRLLRLAGLNESILLENTDVNIYCVYHNKFNGEAIDPGNLFLFESETYALDFLMTKCIEIAETESGKDISDIYEKFPKIERLKERTYEELVNYLEDIEDTVLSSYNITKNEAGLFQIINEDFTFFRKRLK